MSCHHYGLRSQPNTSTRICFRVGPARWHDDGSTCRRTHASPSPRRMSEARKRRRRPLPDTGGKEGGWRAQQHVLLRCAASAGGEEEEISSYHGQQDVTEEVVGGKSPTQKRWPAVDLPRQRRWPTVDTPGWLQMRAASGGGGEAERRG